jgi:hypothetical protein
MLLGAAADRDGHSTADWLRLVPLLAEGGRIGDGATAGLDG